MLDLIQCTSCGSRIGRFSPAINLIKTYLNAKRVQKESISEENLLISTDANSSLKEVFECLGIKKYCCRMHIVTIVNFYLPS